MADLAGARTLLVVPMLKENELIGAITIFRQEVRPFTDKQIELVRNFAGQAVIAIENTRLLNELRQRTDDLSEALEQQTATSEVLQGHLKLARRAGACVPTMLENATRICEANSAHVAVRRRRISIRRAARPAAGIRRASSDPCSPGSRKRPRRAYRSKPSNCSYRRHHGRSRPMPALPASSGLPICGARTLLAVPMLKENELVGAIVIYRQEVRPFTEKQIELVKNFAAQAVIAIENTRLLNELRESLEQQTATSEVLQVISSSPGELKPVFEAMLANATRICEANFGNMYLREGRRFNSLPHTTRRPPGRGTQARTPAAASGSSVLARMLGPNRWCILPTSPSSEPT